MNRQFVVGKLGFILLGLVLASFSIALASIPLQSPENLRKNATHIVVGKVIAIYKDVEKTPSWSRTKGVVEIAIEQVEKGDRLAKGDAVYARFWQTQFVGNGEPPDYGEGHHPPDVKQRVRVFLRAREGGFEALLPNGFEEVAVPDGTKGQKPSR